ncbi:MAG TPA: site-2 protease family protein [Chloroflexota bacterium]|nr:site-2 protease family protein [Chloroflexota bacterium]
MVPIVNLITSGPLLMAGIGSQSLSDIINTILAILIAIDVHELGHALTADRLGDDTPRLSGHISLNPFRHMDQFGIIMLFITSIGGTAFTYGFTPINEDTLRRRTKFGPAIVTIAGPLMNLILAALVALALAKATGVASDGSGAPAIGGNTSLFDFALRLFTINTFLFVFNLVPFPPLDGWKLVSELLTPKARYDLRQVVQYGPMIILALLFFEPQIHFFSNVIFPITSGIENHLLQFWGAPFQVA